MNDRPITRRHVMGAAIFGYSVGMFISYLLNRKLSIKELEEEKRSHISCSLRFPNGSAASYAIRTDDPEAVSQFVYGTSARMTDDVAEDLDAAGPSDPDEIPTPRLVDVTPKDQRPITVNLSITYTGEPPTHPRSEEHLRAIVSDAVLNGLNGHDIPTDLRYNAANGRIEVPEDTLAPHLKPQDPYVTPPVSAEARDYLERDRWTGA